MREKPLAELEDAIYEQMNALEGYLGFAFYDLESGKKILIKGNVTFHAASLMKVPVMIEAFNQSALGKFKMNDRMKVLNRFRSIIDDSEFSITGYNGIFKDADGRSVYISRLVEEMIVNSDNLATNILIDRIGAKNVMNTIKQLGTRNTTILRGVEDIKAFELGKNNRTTPYDMMILMKNIAEGTAVSKKASDEMIAVMAGQKLRGKLPALLPEDIKVAHKTGHISEHHHDAGIVYTPTGNYIIVIMTKGLIDEDEGLRTIARISRMVYDYYMSGKIREAEE